MLEYKLGYFATSLCGHDKGRIYMIVKQEGEMIGLSDGVRRKMCIRDRLRTSLRKMIITK